MGREGAEEKKVTKRCGAVMERRMADKERERNRERERETERKREKEMVEGIFL